MEVARAQCSLALQFVRNDLRRSEIQTGIHRFCEAKKNLTKSSLCQEVDRAPSAPKNLARQLYRSRAGTRVHDTCAAGTANPGRPESEMPNRSSVCFAVTTLV